MAKKQNESEILFAQDELIVNGHKVIVRPYSWAGAIKLAKPLAVIMKTVVGNVDALDEVLKVLAKKPKTEDEEGEQEKGPGLSTQLMVLAEFIDGVKNQEELVQSLAEMVSASTALSVEDVQALMIDDMYKLSKAVYDVNKTFFDKRLVPLMRKSPSEKQET